MIACRQRRLAESYDITNVVCSRTSEAYKEKAYYKHIDMYCCTADNIAKSERGLEVSCFVGVLVEVWPVQRPRPEEQEARVPETSIAHVRTHEALVVCARAERNSEG